MRYSGIIKNDTSAGDGICVTLFVQGCSRRCKGCHNPETWSYIGGEKYTEETKNEILKALNANDIQRNLCIMGGEPLEGIIEGNLQILHYLIRDAKINNNQIKVYLWTGFTLEEIKESAVAFSFINNNIDFLIDGAYIEELRDTTLKWRGSSNQRIWKKTKYGIWIEEK